MTRYAAKSDAAQPAAPTSSSPTPCAPLSARRRAGYRGAALRKLGVALLVATAALYAGGHAAAAKAVAHHEGQDLVLPGRAANGAARARAEGVSYTTVTHPLGAASRRRSNALMVKFHQCPLASNRSARRGAATTLCSGGSAEDAREPVGRSPGPRQRANGDYWSR